MLLLGSLSFSPVCVCIQGYVYSSASRLLGLEISEGFVRLQDSMLHKYKLTDRVQVCVFES